MRTRPGASRSTLLVAALGLCAACSKSAPPPAQPMGGGPTYFDPTKPPAATTPTSAPVATSPPGPAPGSPDAMMLVVDQALDVAMLAQADREAPGMKPEGQPLRVTMKESELSAMVVTLHPGRCYTFIAMSGPLMVSDLEIRLNLLPFNIQALKSGANEKNPVFIGRGAQSTCPVAPFDIQYRVDVVAKRGAGRVVVQMFSRAK